MDIGSATGAVSLASAQIQEAASIQAIKQSAKQEQQDVDMVANATATVATAAKGYTTPTRGQNIDIVV